MKKERNQVSKTQPGIRKVIWPRKSFAIITSLDKVDTVGWLGIMKVIWPLKTFILSTASLCVHSQTGSNSTKECRLNL